MPSYLLNFRQKQRQKQREAIRTQGERAFQAGLTSDANPYKEGNEARGLWAQGFTWALDAAIRQELIGKGVIDPAFSQERGSGRTTAQMKYCPRESLFIVKDGSLGYMRRLAQLIKRGDLEIVTVSSLQYSTRALDGSDKPVTVDHAAVDHLSSETISRLGWEKRKRDGR